MTSLDANPPPDQAPSGPEPAPAPLPGLQAPELLAALRTLHDGGCTCVRVAGSFPDQFVCVGTADQIRRMFDPNF
jgi:hypothetical protein